MELYQLKTFVVVAEEGHLTRASERLHASQPTVSAHIKALEAELETKLFIRTPKGMHLTEAGERLEVKARQVLLAARQLIVEARVMGDELVGDISVGLNTDAEYLRVVPLLTTLSAVHPKITLQIQQSASTAVPELLRAGKIDCGFIFGTPRKNDLMAIKLDTTQFFVAVPDIWKDHIEGGIASLAKLPWIMDPSDNPVQRMINPFFDSNGVRPAVRLEVDGDEVIRVLVAAGRGVSLLRANELKAANRIGQQPVHAVPFEELFIDLYFVCRKRSDQDPVMRALIDCIRSVWELE